MIFQVENDCVFTGCPLGAADERTYLVVRSHIVALASVGARQAQLRCGLLIWLIGYLCGYFEHAKLSMLESGYAMQIKSYSPTNQDLVQRCLAGDAHAWEALVDRYARLVRSVPARHGLEQEDIKDVTQDVFLALARYLHQLEDPEAIGKWLLVTARHRSWRVAQKLAKERPIAAADLSDAEPVATTVPLLRPNLGLSELTELWAQREFLSYGLQKLSKRCQQLLYLLFLDPEQPAYEQICSCLAIPKGSIGPTRKRCLEQLRSILEELEGVHVS
jgi:RNA polymerase sigma factor (sigma-70 family)